MKRHVYSPRPNWQEKANDVGFTYYATPAEPDYGTNWNERVAYEFSGAEIDELESASEELHNRCMEAVDYVVNHPNEMHQLGIPPAYHELIKASWQRQDPNLYGRFDLAYDGKSPPKMLEYNADTPTMLIETSLMQWTWMQDQKPHSDQFNSVHEKLLERFGEIKVMMPRQRKLYFAGLEDKEEEIQTCIYLQDLAIQAGIETDFIDVNKIGYNNISHKFVDSANNTIDFCFKLYPWEWMFNEEFGQHVLKDSTGWLEPVWKSILSNKGILGVLWKLFPNHPNLLAASSNLKDLSVSNYVSKPFLSREGANIKWYENNVLAKQTEGVYADGKQIYQETATNMFTQDGHYAVIGSWIIGHKPAGIIIRDHNDTIIHDRSDVVPHWFS